MIEDWSQLAGTLEKLDLSMLPVYSVFNRYLWQKLNNGNGTHILCSAVLSSHEIFLHSGALRCHLPWPCEVWSPLFWAARVSV